MIIVYSNNTQKYSIMNQYDIARATKNGNMDLIIRCIGNRDIKITEKCILHNNIYKTIMEWACLKGYKNIVKKIMERAKWDTHTYRYIITNCNELFYKLCSHGHTELAKYIMSLTPEYLVIDLAAYGSDAFIGACKNGHISTAKYIMLLAEIYTDINPAARKNLAFYYACYNGHTDTAKYIMALSETYPDINPAAQNNRAFRYAFCNGHMETAQYIMSLAGTYPDIKLVTCNRAVFMVCCSVALNNACNKGHKNTIRYLLSFPDMRHVIRCRTNLAHKSILRDWLICCVKKRACRYIMIEKWRLESVYRVYLT